MSYSPLMTWQPKVKPCKHIFGPHLKDSLTINEKFSGEVLAKVTRGVNRLGARAEYMFSAHSPKNGREAADAGDFELEQYIHLRMLNDGFLITPFHNMALISPDTTAEDVDAHTLAFDKMCGELIG